MPLQQVPEVLGDAMTEGDVTSVYLAAVTHPAATPGELIATGVSPDVLARALPVLRSRGLIDIAEDGTIDVPPPEAALNAYASEIERQARRTRASASSMAMLHRRARDGAEADAAGLRAEALSSVAEIKSATSAIIADAEHAIIAARADAPRTRAMLNPASSEHDQRLVDSTGAPLLRQSVYDVALLVTDGVLPVLRRRVAAGEKARTLSSLPFSVIVVDERAAVIEVTNIDPSGTGSVALTGGPMVAALALLVRRYFGAGVPLPEGRGIGDDHGLSERDRLILALLAGGASDATVARQLDVSTRTVERRVHHLMSVFGAGSRLQVGVEAARRHLV